MNLEEKHAAPMAHLMRSGLGRVLQTNFWFISGVEAVPILMSFPSLTLKYPAVRWANLIVGAFFVLFELYFMFTFYIHDPAYEIFWGIAYLLFALLVVWFAWQWPEQEV